MAKRKFSFTVKVEGEEKGLVAAITPPIDVPQVFATRGRVPVRGTINGFPFRSSLMPMAGRHMIPVNKALREGSGVKAGDVVELVLEKDDEERTVEAPAGLKKFFAKNQAAKAHWEKLPFTHKKEIASWINDAKKEETRTKRIAKAQESLAKGTKWTG